MQEIGYDIILRLYGKVKEKMEKKAGLCLVLFIITLLCFMDTPVFSKDITPKTGDLAPDFQLQSLKGETIKLSQNKGNVVVLVFWAFWCDTWKSVTGGYEELAIDMKNVPFKYIVVAIDPAMPEVTKLEKKDGNLPFPVLVDKDGKVSETYNIKAVPTFFILNKKGNIAYKHEGYPGNKILKKLIWELNKDGIENSK